MSFSNLFCKVSHVFFSFVSVCWKPSEGTCSSTPSYIFRTHCRFLRTLEGLWLRSILVNILGGCGHCVSCISHTFLGFIKAILGNRGGNVNSWSDVFLKAFLDGWAFELFRCHFTSALGDLFCCGVAGPEHARKRTKRRLCLLLNLIHRVLLLLLWPYLTATSKSGIVLHDLLSRSYLLDNLLPPFSICGTFFKESLTIDLRVKLK